MMRQRHGNRVWAMRHKVPPGMTTVLIEDYALLRVAIQHVLERARNTDDILAISPANCSPCPVRSIAQWSCW